MAKENASRVKSTSAAKQKGYSFSSKELQLSIAVLTMIALLGGVGLQMAATSLAGYYGLGHIAISVFLISGYVLIVVLLAIFFSHRLIGPFRRLEYEMRLISCGDLRRRLSIRSKDDLHIRNFTANLNDCIAAFEERNKDFNRLGDIIFKRLSDVSKELLKEKYDRAKLMDDIKDLQKQVHEFKERP